METEKRSVVPQEWGRDWGEMNKQNTENFWDNENTLLDIKKMDICHYSFVQIHKYYKTKSEL